MTLGVGLGGEAGGLASHGNFETGGAVLVVSLKLLEPEDILRYQNQKVRISDIAATVILARFSSRLWELIKNSCV